MKTVYAMKRETMKPLRENEFEIKGGVIIVQSCADDWAHVGIWLRGRMTYHHIDVPSLVLEWYTVYYNDEVKPVEFDAILQENKTRLLEVIQKLNATQQSVQATDALDLPCTCPKSALGFVLVKAHDCPEHCPEHGTPRR